MATEIDAAHVLSSYSSTLTQEKRQLVRDVRELPYPKDVIKLVLKHCIKLAEPGKEREFLRSAYVCLADFQSLSEDEKKSLQVWEKTCDQHDPQSMTQQQIMSLAKNLADDGMLATDVHKRIAVESAALLEELKSLGL
jgi:hypothetical protein